MKISFNWLKQYIELDETPEKVAEVLPLLGFDIESMERLGPPPLENIVVGQIASFTQHPDADRLSVCQVVTDPEAAPHNIVCGAKNFKQGDKVMVALPGAVLPGDFKIKRSKLRGVESAGMLCSAKELGCGDDHAGIMILDPEQALGKSINAVFADADTILDVEVTPNRPDCLSHIGIARELAARFGRKVKYPEVQTTGESSRMEGGEAILKSVEVDEDADCPYYLALRIADVKVQPSPAWLAEAITAIGLRPVNNVVDVTNYVLHELGQPLHAFDAAKIKGGTLRVRRAKKSERITTLDEKVRELDVSMNVIADAERPLVVAGVMGSLDAEVDESTQNVVLESAYFIPGAVRATARKLGLSTDSSYRFERGVDPEGVDFAANRALDLICEVSGGHLAGSSIRCGRLPELVSEITLTPAFVRRKIGFEIEDAELIKHLESLGLEVDERTGDDGEAEWTVGIPSFRNDLERPIDLVEEIVRVYGTDKIPETPVQAIGTGHEDDPAYTFLERSTELLTGRGFDEALLYSLRSADEVRSWVGHSNADLLRLANPLASDQSHLRPSLLPGLLDVLRLNKARGTAGTRFFERGRIFREEDGQVQEFVSVAFVCLLDKDARRWLTRETPDFYTFRALAEEILGFAKVPAKEISFAPVDESRLAWQSGHSATAGEFKRGFVATVGLLDALHVKSWDLEQPVLAGSLYLSPARLERARKRKVRFSPISSFPASVRDLGLLVDAATPAETVQAELTKIARKCTGAFELEALELFDLYEGKGLPEGKKSLAFSIHFRSQERTLRDDEVNPAFDKIQERVASETAYTVRS